MNGPADDGPREPGGGRAMRRSARLRVALVGTRGVPARYGGFETCVEEVGRRLVERGHSVVVYCRTTPGAPPPPAEDLGMRLVHLPAARKRSLETLSHTGWWVAHLLAPRADAAVVFTAANAPLLPVLRAAGSPSPRTWTDSSGSVPSGDEADRATTASLKRLPCAGPMP